jgi:methylenetetrahydrofolate dehydrogenase (NADP+) / methenyltetrahydrofolate cyclohydrolase
MDGKALAERIRAEVADEVKQLGEVGLSTILVGDDPASDVYIRLKQKAAIDVGILARDYRLAEDTSEEELLELIDQLNGDDAVDGILVQLPLPAQIDEPRAIEAVDPAKDVDGFHPVNAGRLSLGHEGVVAATPTGIMALLDEYDVPLEGARAVVVGRSNIVGKPVSLLLLARNATVTICHSRTADLGAHTREADVLVVAVGQAGLVTPEMVKERATVVDVGMNRTEDGLRGDVDPAVLELAGLMTPVPGGVGPMTVASLLRNTVKATRRRRC